MQHEVPTLSYETPRRPNPCAKVSLIGGIILLLGSLVPICGLAVVPLAWAGLVVGLVGLILAIWGKRRGLVASISGLLLCLAAAFIPIGMLSATPFLAELGLKVWASSNKARAPRPAPTAPPSTLPTAATNPAAD